MEQQNDVQPKAPNKKKIIRIAMLALLAVGIIIGVLYYRQQSKYQTTDNAQVEANIYTISCKLAGFVDDVRFEDNQQVKRGDTLLVLDNRELQIKVRQAEIALENAYCNVTVSKSTADASASGVGSLMVQKEELQVRLHNAQKEYDRYKLLIDQNIGSQQSFDKITTEKESLEKKIELIDAQISEVQQKTDPVKKQELVTRNIVKQRLEELRMAKLQYSYSFVTAPADGVVSKKNVQEGQFIQAAQGVCALVSHKDMWIAANLKETQITEIKQGQKVYIELDALPDSEVMGEVQSFSPATGSKFALLPPDNATGNFVKVVQRVPVKIKISDTAVQRAIAPGMSAFVKIQVKD